MPHTHLHGVKRMQPCCHHLHLSRTSSIHSAYTCISAIICVTASYLLGSSVQSATLNFHCNSSLVTRTKTASCINDVGNMSCHVNSSLVTRTKTASCIYDVGNMSCHVNSSLVTRTKTASCIYDVGNMSCQQHLIVCAHVDGNNKNNPVEISSRSQHFCIHTNV